MKKISLVVFLMLTQIYCNAQDSLDIKIGQMIMVGMKGTSVNENSPIIQYIKKQTIGGVLLFEFNLNPIQTIQNLKKLTSSLSSSAKIPLLISIDQEGGRVNRLKQKYGFATMSSAKNIGDKNDYAYTKSNAENISNALKSVGININFAPVLDVHNDSCPVLGKQNRCYSRDANKVSEFAEATIDEMKNNRIIAVGKHFPGHGNSRADSHKGLVDVSKYWKETELLPYKYLIAKNKLEAIMSAHIINNQLDKKGFPATLSKSIITDLLRNQLGFQGVVFSDDMQMHAISSYYGFEQSIQLAINAGVDILIFSNNIDKATQYSPENIHSTIKKLVQNGRIPIERIQESYQRIMVSNKIF